MDLSAEQQQLFHNLEQRYLALKKEHEVTIIKCDSATEKVAHLESSLDSISSKIPALERECSIKTMECVQKDKLIDDLYSQLTEVKSNLERRSGEYTSLFDQMKTQTDEIISTQKRCRELQVIVSTAENQSLPHELEVTKLKCENDSLRHQIQWLETELESKVAEFSSSRLMLINKAAALEAEVTGSQSEAASKAMQLSSLQSRLSIQDEKVDSLMNEVASLEQRLATQFQELSSEIDTQRKFADLYKRNFDETCEFVKELEGRNENLSSSLKAEKLSRAKLIEESVAKGVEVALRDKEALETKLNDLEEQLRNRSAIVSSKLNNPPEFVGISSVTDMYDRVVIAETEANTLSAKNKELESYLNRILADIEAKAPQITLLKRDFNRSKEANMILSKKHDLLLSQISELRENSFRSKETMEKMGNECTLLRLCNQDLSRQVQHLLRLDLERSGRAVGAVSLHRPAVVEDESGIVSDNLVIFDNVTELQSQNEALLSTIRKLTVEKSSALVATTVSDEDVREELRLLKEQRQRSEEMTSQIIQQRDMYKSMFEDYSSTTGGSTNTSPVRPRISEGASWSSGELEAAKGKINELNVRLEKLSAVEQTLNDAVDKYKSEISSLRVELTKSAAEARYNLERYERAENSNKVSSELLGEANQKKAEFESQIILLQSEIRRKEDKIYSEDSRIRQLDESIRRKDIDISVLKASEDRYREQITELREDLKRQVTLLESVHRIEIGLSARVEEEKEQLRAENNNLTLLVEKLRKETNERGILSEHRVIQLEEELKTVRDGLVEKVSEMSSLKESLANSNALLSASRERVELVENQLAIANQRMLLSAVGPDNSGASAGPVDDVLLERALAEIESLKSQLRISQEHTAEYKKISIAAEQLSRELRSQNEVLSGTLNESDSVRKQEMEGIYSQMNELRTLNTKLLMELEESKDVIRAKEHELVEKINELQTVSNVSDAKNSQLVEQSVSINTELSNLRDLLSQAQENYRREVQMHSSTSKQVDELHQSTTALRRENVTLQEKISGLTTKCIQLETSLKEEKLSSSHLVTESRERLSEVMKANNNLLNQVEVLGNQVQRLQTSRLNEFSSNNSVEVSVAQQQEELVNLRNSFSELREVLHYMKRERELLEAKVTVAEADRSRLASSLEVSHKSLDECRAELRALSSAKSLRSPEKVIGIPTSETEFIATVNEITQINILRESNAHLRSENENLSKKMQDLMNDVRAGQESVSPLLDRVAVLQQEKKQLETERDSLKADASYWKDRLHLLVSRYNDIDPEEHRLLQVAKDQVDAELVEIKGQLEVVKSSLASADSVREQHVNALTEQLRVAQEGQVKVVDSFNSQLSGLNQKVAELEAAKKETERKLSDVQSKSSGDDETKKKLSEKEAEVQNLRNEKDNSDKQSERLRAALRSRIAQLEEQKKKLEELTTENTTLKAQLGSVGSAPSVDVAVDAPVETPAAEEPSAAKDAPMASDTTEASTVVIEVAPITSAAPITPPIVASIPEPVIEPVVPVTVPVPAEPVATIAAAPVKLCTFFSEKGFCRLGERCRFRHEAPPAAEGVEAPTQVVPVAAPAAGRKRPLDATKPVEAATAGKATDQSKVASSSNAVPTTAKSAEPMKGKTAPIVPVVVEPVAATESAPTSAISTPADNKQAQADKLAKMKAMRDQLLKRKNAAAEATSTPVPTEVKPETPAKKAKVEETSVAEEVLANIPSDFPVTEASTIIEEKNEAAASGFLESLRPPSPVPATEVKLVFGNPSGGLFSFNKVPSSGSLSALGATPSAAVPAQPIASGGSLFGSSSGFGSTSGIFGSAFNPPAPSQSAPVSFSSPFSIFAPGAGASILEKNAEPKVNSAVTVQLLPSTLGKSSPFAFMSAAAASSELPVPETPVQASAVPVEEMSKPIPIVSNANLTVEERRQLRAKKFATPLANKTSVPAVVPANLTESSGVEDPDAL